MIWRISQAGRCTWSRFLLCKKFSEGRGCRGRYPVVSLLTVLVWLCHTYHIQPVSPQFCSFWVLWPFKIIFPHFENRSWVNWSVWGKLPESRQAKNLACVTMLCHYLPEYRLQIWGQKSRYTEVDKNHKSPSWLLQVELRMVTITQL